MITDSEFVLSCLQEQPHTTMELIQRSYAERRCGLTPHSRVADLRADGYEIRCTRIGTHRGRGVFQYRLVVVGQLELAI